MTPVTGQGVSRLMQSLGRYYVRYINQNYDRTGTLQEGRFKSTLIDSDNYFLTVSRYIELITPHYLYQGLVKTLKIRQMRYTTLFDKIIPDYALEEIRNSINHARVLGDDRFKQQIKQQTGRRASPLPRGGDRKSENYWADK